MLRNSALWAAKYFNKLPIYVSIFTFFSVLLFVSVLVNLSWDLFMKFIEEIKVSNFKSALIWNI